jgi:hypothetical protein
MCGDVNREAAGKYEGYSESNLRWAVNKTSHEKKFIIYKKYVHT